VFDGGFKEGPWEDSGAFMGRAFPFGFGLSLLFGGPGIQLAFVVRWGSSFRGLFVGRSWLGHAQEVL
jgi:hypothetical protein